MKVTGGDYFTLQEIAGILGEPANTIKKRILRLGIKAIAKDALYPLSALNAIRDVKMGRPKKAPENKPAPDKKPPSKTKGKKQK